jgi:hypothetical protein
VLKTSWYHIDGLGYFDSKRVVFISDPVETEYTYSYRVLIEGADPFYCTTARPEDIPAARVGYQMLVKLVCEESPLSSARGSDYGA